MDKNTFLTIYTDIETKTFVRADKNKKFLEFLEKYERSTNKLTLKDVLEVIESLLARNITIRQPLFKKVIYPILCEQIELNNVAAIKGLLKLDRQLVSYQAYTGDEKYSSGSVLEQGLTIVPDDVELLQRYESKTRDYLWYTLHELPTGVLYGNDGASIEECEEILEEANKYETVCGKLGRDEGELIGACRFYYGAYQAYLATYKDYKNFADYLDKIHKGYQ